MKVATQDDEAVSDNKLVLRPLIGLFRGLSTQETEPFVVAEIEKHRRLRDETVELERRLEKENDASKRQEITNAYISAMIAVHAQQTVVSTLLDILGYIPEIPERRTH